ncbi:MAG: polymer-forming cytoskeletal protein [Caldisericia bacterium]
MRRGFIRKVFAVVIVLAVLLGVGAVFAQPVEEGVDLIGIKAIADTNPKTDNDFVHEGDLYMAGQNCIVIGEISGNVFAGGQDVKFSNPKITGSAFIGASTYSGDIDLGGSMYLFAGSINDNSNVTGNVYAFGGNVILTGTYDKSVVIYAGEVTLTSSCIIMGDLEVSCENLTIDDSAVINGKANISVGSEEAINKLPAKYQTDAKIEDYDKNYAAGRKKATWRTLIISPIFMFLLGMIFIRFWEDRFKHIQKMVKEKFGWAILTGLGALLLAPIVGLILIILLWPASIFPVIAIIFAVYLMASLGGIVIMQMLGKWLWKLTGKEINKYLALATGVVIVHLIFCLPLLVSQIAWITVPAYLLLYLVGSGAFTLSVFNKLENQ